MEGLRNIKVSADIDLAFHTRAACPSLEMEVVARRLQGTYQASFSCNSSSRAVDTNRNPCRSSPFKVAFVPWVTEHHTSVVHRKVTSMALSGELLKVPSSLFTKS